MSIAGLYVVGGQGDTYAMIEWLKRRLASRPEALSHAEQNERPEGYDVHSTSKELEMTCLEETKTLTENEHSLISEDADADTGMVLERIFKRIFDRLAKIETELAKLSGTSIQSQRVSSACPDYGARTVSAEPRRKNAVDLRTASTD